MVTRDHGAGLLSRVAGFVGHPTRDGLSADPGEAEFDSGPELAAGAAKERLKETIERKRQNDLVRRREFDQLRKIRRNRIPGAGSACNQASDFRPGIGFNLDERAMMLRKIDEIEAQMSRQWWMNKTAPLQPADLPTAVTVQASGNPSGPRDSEYVSTQAGWLDSQDSGVGTDQIKGSVNAEWHGRAPPEPAAVSPAAMRATSTTTTADAELEPAAILFANGEDAAVAANLLTGWRGCALDVRRSVAWATALFDFYRATARQADFERLALECCVAYDVAPPAWSEPRCQCREDAASDTGSSLSRAAAASADSPPARFELVGELRGNVQALLHQFEVAPLASQTLLIDCARLIRVDFAAAGSLLNWLAARRGEPGRVRFCNVAVLVAIFFQLIGIGDDAEIQSRQA